MVKFDERKFNFEKNLGKEFKCIEMVTNSLDEISVEIYILEENENQEEICERLNKENKDKNFKYIGINYKVCEDYLEVI